MRRVLIATAALLAVACAPQAQARKLGSLDFKACSLSTPFSGTAIPAQCAVLQVPENPAAPTGRRIGLKIAWIPAARDDAAEPDPVFMLAGGPGQSATESYPQAANAFDEVRKKRHLILVDQRGTGGSNALSCKEPYDGNELATPQAAGEYTGRCLAALSGRADPRFYGTTEAIQDLELVRKAIGAPQVNLVGISYGTRVAQQYAARYPASTRTIVLDGVAPNSLVLGNEFARNLEDALDLQFALCAKTPTCVQRFGNPREKLRVLMARLATDPPLVTYRDGITGEGRQERLTPQLVAGLVRMYAYMPLASSLLPLQLNEAANGRYDALMSLSKMLGEQMADSINIGMQLSVICTEDGSELKANPADEGTLLGNDFSTYLVAQCAAWPKGVRPAGFRAPLKTAVPALLLSGEFDPVTPSRYGDAVLKTLSKGRHLVLRGQGHNVIGIGCMPRLMAQFIDTSDARALDAKCLDKLAYTPPFTGFYGWEP
ncbi:MAG: alpha/beta hydrolase [Lysobacteraceae bacterium]|nr:MAG: alpha/beta hydrolase [Xanthomonadaceae bacterium]